MHSRKGVSIEIDVRSNCNIAVMHSRKGVSIEMEIGVVDKTARDALPQGSEY